MISGSLGDRPTWPMALKFRYEQRTVTRELAAKLIQELNTGNRKLHEPHVFTISNDMAKGAFVLNPQPVIIHEDLKKAAIRVIDGQHRLYGAARKAPEKGVPLMFCFVQGTDAEITALQQTIDGHKPRTTGDRGGFQGLGIPQGYLEKAAMLYQVIGQSVFTPTNSPTVYGWMDAPKVSYSGCREFGNDQAVLLLSADQLAAQHCQHELKGHQVTKQYLALAYLVALMNGAEQDELQQFANAAADPKSVLSCKLKEVWHEQHPFCQRVKEGSKNASGIQFLLMRDLLLCFLTKTLSSTFQPVLNMREVDGATLTEFSI